MLHRLVITVACLLIPSSPIFAQQLTTIRGTVQDSAGQPSGGALVTLLDRVGLPVATTHADTAARFYFTDVQPGTYTVFAEHLSERSAGKIVTVATALPVDLVLQLVPALTETVVIEATADAPPVTTRMTLSGAFVRAAPVRLRSRGVQHALTTLPGWASEDNGLVHVRGVDDGFLYVEDGVPVYDRIDATFGIAPDPSSVGAMQVLTGYIPAEYGMKSGAVIEVQSTTSPRPGWLGGIDLGVGSEAGRSARSAAGGPIGTRTSLGLDIAAERSNRFLDPVHPDNFHNRGGVVSGNARAVIVGSDNDLLRFNIGGGRSRFDVPHGDEQEEAGQDQRQRLSQHSESGSWQRAWSNDVASQVSLYRRSIQSNLYASEFDTPVTAASDRQHVRFGGLGSLTHQRGRHTLKAGAEVAHVGIREHFLFGITDEDEAEEMELSEGAIAFTEESPFIFADAVGRWHWSLYAQDTFRMSGRMTVDFGVRFDRTRLLVPATAWSPRIGAAYHWPSTGTTLRSSVNRFFQPPQPEHLLLSSSPGARALSPFVHDDDASEEGSPAGAAAGGAALEPERQTAWEIGLEQWLRGVVRLDGAYWSRHVRNYADPNVFFGTTIVFPNSVASGRASGLDLRLEVPRYRRWSGYVSYTNARVVQFGPINGGLFLEDEVIEIGPGEAFTPDHDQRHVGSAGLTYAHSGGMSASLAVRYESGTPLEVDEDEVDELTERPGAELVDFERGRVKPRALIDLAVSQPLWRRGNSELSVRASLLNVTGRQYALNFGNPFSGTHFGAPRTAMVELSFTSR